MNVSTAGDYKKRLSCATKPITKAIMYTKTVSYRLKDNSYRK